MQLFFTVQYYFENGNIVKFVTLFFRFLPSLAEAIQGRVKTHLSSPLVATGCLPPVNVLADGATYQHKKRQIIGVVTIVPGSQQLLQAFFLDAPLCPNSTGDGLATSIISVVEPLIRSTQFMGFTGDGVYYKCHVGEKLNDHFGTDAVFTWDKMHKAALVDTAMRNPNPTNTSVKHVKEYQWVNDMTVVITNVMKFVNWGKGEALFTEVKLIHKHISIIKYVLLIHTIFIIECKLSAAQILVEGPDHSLDLVFF